MGLSGTNYQYAKNTKRNRQKKKLKKTPTKPPEKSSPSTKSRRNGEEGGSGTQNRVENLEEKKRLRTRNKQSRQLLTKKNASDVHYFRLKAGTTKGRHFACARLNTIIR